MERSPAGVVDDEPDGGLLNGDQSDVFAPLTGMLLDWRTA